MNHAEVWWLEPVTDKRRPVLIVTRTEALGVVNNVMVAPITSTIRRIATTIVLGVDEGLDHESVAMFDNLALVPRRDLVRRIGRLDPARHDEICDALSAVADC